MIDFKKFAEEFHEEEGQHITVNEDGLIFRAVDLVSEIHIATVQATKVIWDNMRSMKSTVPTTTQTSGLIEVY